MKKVWIILIVLAALGALFVWGYKSKKSTTGAQEQQVEQPDFSAIPKEPASARQSPAKTSQTGQPQTSVEKAQSSAQPSDRASSESATATEAEKGSANPDVKAKSVPFKAPVMVKAIKIKKIDEDQKDQEDQ